MAPVSSPVSVGPSATRGTPGREGKWAWEWAEVAVGHHRGDLVGGVGGRQVAGRQAGRVGW